MEGQGDIIAILDEKIELAGKLIKKLEDDFIHIDGARKTQRNIGKELKFLLRVSLHFKFTFLTFKL
jgi:hypothetical protein